MTSGHFTLLLNLLGLSLRSRLRILTGLKEQITVCIDISSHIYYYTKGERKGVMQTSRLADF